MSVLAGAVRLVAADPGTEGMAEARSTASATEFAEIFERHHDSAYRLACLLCGDRSVAPAPAPAELGGALDVYLNFHVTEIDDRDCRHQFSARYGFLHVAGANQRLRLD